MERKPTMNDVARAAGVGTMTVSRVLNASQHVSKATAERVMRAVKELDYRPNEMARCLRGSKSRTIGLIVPNLHDSFYATCADSINRVAQEHGYTVLLTTSNDDAAREYSEAQMMLQRYIEGLAVIPADPQACRLVLPEFHNTPIVALDRPVEDDGARHGIDAVLVENHKGSRDAVRHLVDCHGHRNILFLGLGAALHTMRSRYEGYREAMDAAGLTPYASFECGSSEAASRLLLKAIESGKMTALFCGNNLVTRQALYALLQLGIRIPEDFALIGFDDFELADLLHPALTVVRQPVAGLGETAARLLFHKLLAVQPPRSPAKRVVLEVEFVQRHSCGCAYTRVASGARTKAAGEPVSAQGRRRPALRPEAAPAGAQ